MRWTRLLAILPMLAAGAAHAAAGDQLFAGDRVHAIELTFARPDYWDSLLAHYHAGREEYLPATVIVDGVTYDSVGVRLKGNSSFDHPNDKKSIRLSFDEYRDAQRLDGLKGVHLDNCWRDPTFLRAKLHLDFLREAGVPGPRAGFATVALNGEPWGLYSLVEHVDKTFLSSRFGSKNGPFFKAVDGLPPSDLRSDFVWYGPDAAAYADRYELKSDEPGEAWDALLEVLDAVAHAAEPAVAWPALVDVETFSRAMAADNLLGNLDSYAGSGRNFYVYFEPSGGRMEWIAWDAGLSFGDFWTDRGDPGTIPPDFVSDPAGRPLFARMLGDTALRRAHLATYEDLYRTSFSVARLSARIDTLAALVRPFVRADGRKMYSTAQFETNLSADLRVDGQRIPGLKSFLAARVATLEAWFGATGGPAEAAVSVAQNHPNPAHSRTTVEFELAAAGRARLEVFDLAGRRVGTPLEVEATAGPQAAELDVSRLRPGLYVYRVTTRAGAAARRMLVLP